MNRKQKLKVAFAIFFGLTISGLTGGVMYLESERFGRTVKRMISERSPQKLGIVGDFSNLKLYFFPPGVGVANPKMKIERENVSNLPLEADIEAKELRVNFAPIQMLSGTVLISEVLVSNGSVRADLGPDFFSGTKKPKKDDQKLTWQDLFTLQINGVRFENTYLNVQATLPRSDQPKLAAEFVVKSLDVRKEKFKSKYGIASHGLVNAVKFEMSKQLGSLPINEANQLQWDIEFTDEHLKLNPFVADFSGTNINLTGEVRGNLLDEHSDPILHTDVIAISELSNFFKANFEDDQWAGRAKVVAQVSAQLKDVKKTLKGKFEIEGNDLSYKNATVTSLSGKGELDLEKQSISLSSLKLQDSPERGGSVLVDSTRFSLKMNEPFSTGLKLERADMHWLGGAVLRQVYPLEGKLTGEVQLQFNPSVKGKWLMKTQTALTVENFALTNQKLGEKRKKYFVLKPVVPLHLNGALSISPLGLDFDHYKVKMNETNFDVAGGIHRGVFDFTAEGHVDLKEMNEIAENPVRGAGELKAHIHGPDTGVILDFDTRLKGTEYLNLQFGEVDGKISYDDGVYELRFTNIHAKQQSTFYSVNDGYIDLNTNGQMHLPFQIHSGRVEDVALILSPLTQKISWFPKTLRGELHGKAELAGRVDSAHMIISSDLDGSDWQWLGERARKVKMNLGFDQGTYFARNVLITKTNGDIKGDIDFVSSTDEMKWDFRTDNFSLTDIDFIDRLEIPAKSKIELLSVGSGKMDRLRSKTEGRFTGTELKGEKLDPSVFTLEISENNLISSLSVFGSRLQSQFKYAMLPKQPSTFQMTFDRFDFSPVLLILNPKLLDDNELKGVINGRIRLDFLSTQSEYARGEIKINDYSLAKKNFTMQLGDPIDMPIQLGYFNLKPASIRFKNGELKLSGEGHKGDIDLRLAGTTDMSIVELLSSSVQRFVGKADTEIHVSGPLKELKVNGDVSFNNAYGLMRFMQTPFEEVDGTLRIRQGQLYVENVEAYLGDEVFSMNGKIETYTDRFPKLDLRAQFDDNKIKMIPLDLVQVRGIATIKGEQPPYVIGGNIDVLQALWTKSFSSGSGGGVARGERFAPKDRDQQLASNIFNLDLNITANQSFFVRNEIMDGEFRGKVKLIGPPENPKLLGSGQLVQGKVLFRDRPFIFETAKIEFDDPFQLNPKFNISAVSEVNQYKIKVLAFGRTSSWKAEFSSTPYLAENEIYSLLASGLTTSDTGRFRTRDRSYVNQGEAASLILHSMEFSKDVQSKTGLQFDVEEAVDNQSASSVFRPQSLSDNIAAPKLVIKRQLGRQFDLSFGSTVGVGNQSQKEVNAEYKLTSGMSVLGVWNNIEEVNTRDTRTSFGLDMKFNRKFK